MRLRKEHESQPGHFGTMFREAFYSPEVLLRMLHETREKLRQHENGDFEEPEYRFVIGFR